MTAIDEPCDILHLPYFWTHDGTLHIELPKLPESISVRLPDQRDREVGSARTWQYTQTPEEVLDENAKLIVKLNAKHIVRQNAEAENAKLRELVRDMWREGAFEAGACYEKAAERLEERTREFGIEVYK